MKWPARQADLLTGKRTKGGEPLRCLMAMICYNSYKRIYQAYRETCDQGGLVDFAELLLRSHELWLNDPTLLQHYQRYFTGR